MRKFLNSKGKRVAAIVVAALILTLAIAVTCNFITKNLDVGGNVPHQLSGDVQNPENQPQVGTKEYSQIDASKYELNNETKTISFSENMTKGSFCISTNPNGPDTDAEWISFDGKASYDVEEYIEEENSGDEKKVVYVYYKAGNTSSVSLNSEESYSFNGNFYSTLAEAYAAIKTSGSEGIIKVEGEEVTDDSELVIDEGMKVTLDTNGNKIIKTVKTITNNGTFNIVGSGTIESELHHLMNNYGTLELDGANIVGTMSHNDNNNATSFIRIYGGLFKMISGTIDVTDNQNVFMAAVSVSNAEIVLESGTISGIGESVCGVHLVAAEMSLEDGDIISSGLNSYTVYIKEASNLEITGGRIVNNSQLSETNNNCSYVIGANDSSITITDGTISSNSRYVEGIRLDNSSLEVSGGKILNECSSNTTDIYAIRALNSSSVLITDGEIISNGYYGIAVTNSSLTLEGGTIEGATYAIRDNSTGTNVTIGKDDGTVSKDSPVLIGGQYAIKVNETFNFYDGILKGKQAAYVSPTKPNIPTGYAPVISNDGTYEIATLGEAEPILMAETSANVTAGYILGNTKYSRANVLSITIKGDQNTPDGTIIDTWDVSADGFGGVTAWLVQNADTTKYDLVIGGKGKVIASNGKYLFKDYTSCKAISGLDKLDTSRVTDMRYMFYNCNSLQSLDLSDFDTSKVKIMIAMFYKCSSLTYIDVSSFDFSGLDETVYETTSGVAIITGLSKMFEYCSSLETIDVSRWDTSNVTNMSSLFAYCTKLKNINLSNFDTSNVKDFAGMFALCESLETLDLSNFDTSSAKTMGVMFGHCYKLTNLNVSNFDFSSLDGTVSHWGLEDSLTIDIEGMFYACFALKSLDLSKWDTSNVSSIKYTFYACRKLEGLDVSNFDTKNMSNMKGAFAGCYSLKSLDLSSFDTTNVTNMDVMFKANKIMESVVLGPKFDRLIGTDMFTKCASLKAIITQSTTPMELDPTVTGLNDLIDAKLYVQNEAVEDTFEAVEDYITVFGEPVDGDIARIKPILELVGEDNLVISSIDTYTEEGVKVAGFTNDEATNYTQYGYTLEGPVIVKGNVEIDEITEGGDYEIVYSLTYKDGSTIPTVVKSRNIFVKNAINPVLKMENIDFGSELPMPTVEGNLGGGDVIFYYNTKNSTTDGMLWSNIKSTSDLPVGTYYMYAVVSETDDYVGATTEPIAFEVAKGNINTEDISIDGNTIYGETLVVDTSSLMYEDFTYEYKWYSNSEKSTTGGTLIADATDNYYTIGGELVGQYIYAEVKIISANYNDALVTIISETPVEAKDMNSTEIKIIVDPEYEQTQRVVIVTDRGEELLENTDYALTYDMNDETDVTTISATGLRNYKNTKTVVFQGINQIIRDIIINNKEMSGSVEITGTNKIGETLTVTDTIVPEDAELIYQWYASENGTYTTAEEIIANAQKLTEDNKSTYVVGEGLANKYIYVVVTASAEKYNTAQFVDVTDERNTSATTQRLQLKEVTLQNGPSFVYNGLEQEILLNDFDSNLMNIEGNKAKNQGSYEVIVSIKDTKTYEWENGSVNPIKFSWSITKKAMTIHAGDFTKEYDGTPLTYSSATPVIEGMMEFHNISIVRKGEITEVGAAPNIIESYTITGDEGDVTDNYEVTTVVGTLKVTAKELSASDLEFTLNPTEFTYDGTAKTPVVSGRNTNTNATVTVEDDFTVEYTNNVEAGKGIITLTGKGNYKGTKAIEFTINARPITITSATGTKQYDGTALTKNEYEITEGTLVDGHKETVTITGTQTIVGSSANTISSVVIKDANGNDVTKNYDITEVEGTLSITVTENYSFDGVYYQTLATAYAAIKAKGNEGTIIVVADEVIDDSELVVDEGMTVTLDTNGNKIIKTEKGITNNGTFNIIGSGTIESGLSYFINSYGTLHVDGANIIGDISDSASEGGAFIRIYGGLFEMTSGKIEAYNNATIRPNAIKVSDAEMKLEGGIINSSGLVAVKLLKSNITITSGSINGIENTNLVVKLEESSMNMTSGNIISKGKGAIALQLIDSSLESTGGNIINEYQSTVSEAVALVHVTDSDVAIEDINIKTTGYCGIYLEGKSSLVVEGGTIEGGKYAIRGNGTDCSITIGKDDGTVSTDSPVLIGGTNAIKVDGTFNFYDGILKGGTSAYNVEPTKISNSYGIVKGTEKINEVDYETAVLRPYLMERDSDSNFYALGALRADNSNDIENKLDYTADKIVSIKIIDTTKEAAPTTYAESWDVSAAKDGSITAWLVEKGTEQYELQIGSNGKILAPVNSINLFRHYINAKQITGLDNLDTSRVTDMRRMFTDCNSLQTLDLSKFDTSKVKIMIAMFYNCSSLTSIDVSSFDFSGLDETVYETLSGGGILAGISRMFQYCSSLETLYVSMWDTKNVTHMNSLFAYCTKLKNINLSNFDTSNVKDFSGMFTKCESLETLNLSNFDTSSAKVMALMFNQCSNLANLNVSSFDFSSLDGTTSSWNAGGSPAIDLDGMFQGCFALTSLDLSKWDTSNVSSIYGIFNACRYLESVDVSNFDTKNMRIMTYAFRGCYALKSLDLSSFDTTNVTNMNQMFENNTAMESVVLGPKFDKLVGTNMFAGCAELKAIITQRTTPMELNTTATGLNDLTDAKLYIQNEAVEDTFEAVEDYITVFGEPVDGDIVRIQPILELIGDKDITISASDTYVEQGAKVAGYTNDKATNYTQYGYTLNGPVFLKDVTQVDEIKAPGKYEVVYSLTYKDGSVIPTVTVTRNVVVLGVITPVVSMESYAYGSTLPTPSVEGNNGNGEVTYYYNTVNSNENGTAWSTVKTSTDLPVGKYYMYAVVEASGDYNFGISEPVEFEVTIGTIPTENATILGDTIYGETLVADTSDITDIGFTYEYQWYSNDINSTTGGTQILGATERSYTIGRGLVGDYIYVVISISKENYTPTTITLITETPVEAKDMNSTEIKIIVDPNYEETQRVIIVTDRDEILIEDTDYSLTYELDDENDTTTISATGIDNYKNTKVVVFEGINEIIRDIIIKNYDMSGNVTITGTNKIGETLTVTDTIIPEDAELTYQWYVSNDGSLTTAEEVIENAQVLNGETNSTYTVGEGLADAYVYVVVTATAENYNTTQFVDVTDNNNGSATIQRLQLKEVTLKNGPNFEYNGLEQEILLNDVNLELMTVEGTKATNQGSYIVTVTIKDTTTYEWESGSKEPLKLAWSIGKKELTITAGSYTKEYDGKPLTHSSATTVVNGMMEFHSISVVTSGSITEVGTVENVIESYNVTDLDGNDVTHNYTVKVVNGILEITAKDLSSIDLEFTLNPAEYIYDATAKEPTVSGRNKNTNVTLTSGDDFTVQYDNNVNASTDTNKATVTLTASGNYKGTKTLEFTINSRPITITTPSANKPYDGTALTKNEYEITEGTLVNGHIETVSVTGSQTQMGSSANTIGSVVIKDANGNDVTANYAITKNEGTLTVTVMENYSLKSKPGTFYATLADAYAEITGAEDTIIVEAEEVTDDSELIIADDKIVTLDTNGNKIIKTEKAITNNGTFNIVGSGTIEAEFHHFINSYGTLHLDGANIIGTTYSEDTDVDDYTYSFVRIYSGLFKMTSGAIELTNYKMYNCRAVNATFAEVILEGGTITSKANNNTAPSTTIVLSEATLKVSGARLVNESQISSDSGYSTSVINADRSNIIITDGTISSNSRYLNSIDLYNSNLEVRGGTILNECASNTNDIKAIYSTYNSNILVTDGEIISKGYVGIALFDSSSLVVEGGTIEGYRYAVRGNGSNYSVTLGNDDGNVSTDSPVLIGNGTNAIKVDGNFKFYDGILKGKKAAYVSATEPNTPTGYVPYISNDGTYYTAVLKKAIEVTLNKDSYEYTGIAITPDITVSWQGTTLTAGTDYEVKSTGNVDAGTNTAKVTVTGIGDYTGSFEKTFTITPKQITVTWGSNNAFVYNKEAQAPTVTTPVNGVNGEKINLVVEGTGTDVGGYTATAKIASVEGGQGKASNYTLADNTKAFVITQADGYITLKENNGESIYGTATHTFEIDTHHGGQLTATTNVSGVTANVSDKTVTISGLANVNAGTVVTVTVKVGATDNYKEASTTYTLTVKAKGGVTFVVTLPQVMDTEYDGTQKKPMPTSVTANGTKLTENVDYTLSWGENTNAGTNAGSVTATGIGNYFGSSGIANFTITPKPITLTAGSYTKVYDGTALTSSEVIFDLEDLVDGHTLSAPTTGSITNVGKVDNIISEALVRITDTNGNDVTSNYDITTVDGKLEVTARPITITSANANKPFDGTALTKNEYEITAGTLANGHKETVTITGTQTVVGSSANTISNVVIKDAEGNDVTSNYEVAKVAGTLEVTANSNIKFEITFDNDSFVYNGEEQKPNVKVEAFGEELTEGTDYDVSFSEDTTNVGTVTVVITGKGDYTTSEGRKTYEITPRPITITSASANKPFDGTPLTKDEYEITSGTLVSGHKETVTITGTQTVVGSSANTISNVVIKDANGNDVTSNYEVAKVAGTLEVTTNSNIDFTITFDNDSFVYNGESQKPNVTVEAFGDELDADTDYEVSFSGDTTNVGTVTVVITGKGNFATSEGRKTYEITPRPITITSANANKPFDGTPLTKDEYEITEGTLVDEQTVVVRITGSQTEIGTSANTIESVIFRDADGNDVTKNYDVTTVEGTLTVDKPRDVAGEVIVTGTPRVGEVLVANTAGIVPAGCTYTYTWYANDTNTTEGGTEIMGATSRRYIVSEEYEGKYIYVVVTATKENYEPGTFTDVTNIAILGVDEEMTDSGDRDVIVERVDINSGDVSISIPDEERIYNGKAYAPEVTVTEKGASLVIDKDYIVEYIDNVEAGTAKITVTGIGAYKGTKVLTFEILKRVISIRPQDVEKVYDGTPLKATVIEFVNGELAEEQILDATISGERTDVGTTISEIVDVTIKDAQDNDVTKNYDITIEDGTITITTKEVTFDVTLSGYEFIYDGTEIVPIITVKDGETEVVKDKDYTLEIVDNKDAGTAKITITGIGNYEGSTGYAEFVILKRTLEITVGSASKVYDGDPLTLDKFEITSDTSLAPNHTLSITIVGSITNVGSVANKVDSYLITDASGDVTYNYDVRIIEGTLEVTEGIIDGSVEIIGTNKIGETLTAKVDVTPDTSDLTYAWYYNFTDDMDSGTLIENVTGNTYTIPEGMVNRYIYVVVTAKEENYKDATFTDITDDSNGSATVVRADINPTVNMEDYVYGGTISVPSVDGNTGNGTVTYYYNTVNEATGGTDWATVSSSTSLDVGTYYMYAVVAETDNYNSATTDVKEFKVTPMVIDFNVTLDNEEIVYTGTEVKPTVTIVVDGETLTEGEDYRVEYENNINVGTATVKVIGIGNYEGSEGTKEFEIIKRAIEITAASDEKVYDGTALINDGYEITSGTLADNQDIEVKVTGSRLDVGTSANVIESVIITNASGDDVTDNYDITKVNGELKVTPKIADFDVTLDKDSYTYAGTEIKPIITVKDGETLLDEDKDYDFEYSNNVNAGTGIITITGKGNYEGSKKVVEFTINKKQIEITAGSASKDYDGEPLTEDSYEITNGGLVGEDKLSVKVAGSITNVGTASNTIIECIITNANGDNVNDNYDIHLVDGTLEVKAKEVKGSVVITGENKFGETLTAEVTVDPEDSELSFRWYVSEDASGTNLTLLSETSGNTYTIGEGLVGKYIVVVVNGTKQNYVPDEFSDITDGPIEKADPTFSLDVSDKVTIVKGNSFEVGYTHIGEGTVTATASDDIITITQVGDKFVVTGTELGTANAIFTLSADDNYNEMTITIEVEVIEANYSVTKGGTTNYYNKLEDAVKDGGEVVVIRDVNDTSTNVVIDKNITLDLGGYDININTPITIEVGGALVVDGLSGSGIISTSETAIVNNGGALIIGNTVGAINLYPRIEGNTNAISGNFTFNGGILAGSDNPPFVNGTVTLEREYTEIITELNGDKYESILAIESTKPVITVEQDIYETTNNDVTLTITVTDNLSGVKSLSYVFDGKTYEMVFIGNGIAELIVSENGIYKFIAEDNAGNIGILEYEVDNIDKLPGNVTNIGIEGMATDNIVTNTTVILNNIKVDTNDVDKVFFANSSDVTPTATTSGWVTYTNDMSIPWVLDNSEGNGAKTIYAWAMDATGNISNTPYRLNITLATKLIGGANNKVTISVVGLDRNFRNTTLALANVKVLVNGANMAYTDIDLTRDSRDYVQGVLSGRKFNITLTNAKGSGRIDINLAANTLLDRAGNVNDETTIETDYYVDTTAPSISFTGTTLNVSDNENNLLAVTVNGVIVTGTDTNYGTVKDGDIIKAYDKAGNVTEYEYHEEAEGH